MIEELKKYAMKFDINDQGISRKYYHSLRVQKISEEIAKHEKLDKEEYELASVIGLLHDFGRFYQWHKYQTFNDLISLDHGDYGASELIDKNLIENFYNKKENYQIIYEAIKYHNKYSVPEKVISKKLCNLIRDADKLDILHMFKTKESIISDKGKINKRVEEDFMNDRLVDNKNLSSEADRCLQVLSLIFDLNYEYSFEYLKAEKIIESIYDQIEDKEKMKKYFEKTEKYIERRCKKC